MTLRPMQSRTRCAALALPCQARSERCQRCHRDDDDDDESASRFHLSSPSALRIGRDHAAAARTVLSRTAVAIDRGVRRHGRALAERQLEVGALAAVVRDAAGVLAIAHHADARGDDAAVVTADVWCRIALSRATGRRLTPADHAAIGALGRAIADGMA